MPMAILAPLPTPGSHGQMEHPLLGLACAAVAVALVVAFARGYAAANPPETAAAIRRGDAKPVWTRAMWLQILGAFASMGLMVALG